MKDRNLLLIEQLLEVWEDSVKATHLFLSKEEIENIKKACEITDKCFEHVSNDRK